MASKITLSFGTLWTGRFASKLALASNDFIYWLALISFFQARVASLIYHPPTTQLFFESPDSETRISY